MDIRQEESEESITHSMVERILLSSPSKHNQLRWMLELEHAGVSGSLQAFDPWTKKLK